MAAGQHTFTIEQGTTVDFRVDYLDSNNVPVNLNDWESRMQVRAQRDKTSTLYLSLSSSRQPDGTGLNMTPRSGSLTLPRTSGSIGVYISAATSSNLNFSEAYYDLEIFSGSLVPYVIRLLEGKIKLKKEVTG